MIKLTTSSSEIDTFILALRQEQARLDREITKVYVAWTQRIFRELVEGSPQWSGDMTANWNYSVNTPDYSYAQIPNKTGDSGIDHWSPHENQGVYHAGHPYAVDMAMQAMMQANKPTWRDKVFIANGAPIAWEVQTGAVKVRPVNLVGGAVVTMYSVAAKEELRATP